MAATTESGTNKNWKQIVAAYQRPATHRALWQIVNTVATYALAWLAMYWSLGVSYWLTAGLAVLSAGLLVRIFIIFHDCGHGSFFASKRANDILGFITGFLTFTPYYHWRWEHALHHATAGDLDRRGVGDVWTMTVEEYLKAPWRKRLEYRLARNPVILFLIAPLILFLFVNRVSNRKAGRKERISVYATNVAILLMVFGMSWLMGWKAYLILQVGIMGIASAVGVWLFYVQHQFEGVYWERQENWDYFSAAIQGSSFYKLPKVLQWFSGNIGFHHIHHLSPRIPNYNLERCHKAEPLFQTVKPITLLSSLKSFKYRLWDEKNRRLVGYRVLREIARGGSTQQG